MAFSYFQICHILISINLSMEWRSDICQCRHVSNLIFSAFWMWFVQNVNFLPHFQYLAFCVCVFARRHPFTTVQCVYFDRTRAVVHSRNEISPPKYIYVLHIQLPLYNQINCTWTHECRQKKGFAIQSLLARKCEKEVFHHTVINKFLTKISSSFLSFHFKC